MAWIESHQNLENHPKLVRLCALTGWDQDAAIGKLQRLWWWALTYAEDGNLGRFEPVQYLERLDKNIKPGDILAHLITSGWVDLDGKLHDWIDYAGYYLIKKYSSSNPQRLKKIWSENCRKYGKKQVHTKRPKSDLKATVPNHTLPNLTITKPKPISVDEAKGFFLEKKSNALEAEKFFNYYEANGWRVGKNPMKNWKAAASGWISRNPQAATPKAQEKKSTRTWTCDIQDCRKEMPESEKWAHITLHRTNLVERKAE